MKYFNVSKWYNFALTKRNELAWIVWFSLVVSVMILGLFGLVWWLV